MVPPAGATRARVEVRFRFPADGLTFEPAGLDVPIRKAGG